MRLLIVDVCSKTSYVCVKACDVCIHLISQCIAYKSQVLTHIIKFSHIHTHTSQGFAHISHDNGFLATFYSQICVICILTEQRNCDILIMLQIYKNDKKSTFMLTYM